MSRELRHANGTGYECQQKKSVYMENEVNYIAYVMETVESILVEGLSVKRCQRNAEIDGKLPNRRHLM